MQYVFHEPDTYGFTDRNGHSGKFFQTKSRRTQHLIIECNDKLSVTLMMTESEFNYYILEGAGYFVFDGRQQAVTKGDLVVIPPGTSFSFGGTLRMLLINTPRWSPDQESVAPNTDIA